jgi:hypothetical protein
MWPFQEPRVILPSIFNIAPTWPSNPLSWNSWPLHIPMKYLSFVTSPGPDDLYLSLLFHLWISNVPEPHDLLFSLVSCVRVSWPWPEPCSHFLYFSWVSWLLPEPHKTSPWLVPTILVTYTKHSVPESRDLDLSLVTLAVVCTSWPRPVSWPSSEARDDLYLNLYPE